MTDFSCRRTIQAGIVLWGVLLLVSILGVSSRGQTSSFRVVDSLRAAGCFQAALGRLSEVPQARSGSLDVLWRRSLFWSDYGLSRFHSGDDQGARSAFRKSRSWAEKAIVADSSSAWAHLVRAAAAGRTAILANDTQKTIQLSRAVRRHADRALELDATMATAYHIRGVWHSEVARVGVVSRAVVRVVYGGFPEASLEQAVTDLTRAIELEPRAASHLELGKVYQGMGRIGAARAQFRAALEVTSIDPFVSVAKRSARKRLHNLE